MAGPLLLDPEDNSNPNNPNSSSYVSNSPLFPLNRNELLRVAKILLKSGLPTSISFVCGFASGLVCLRFAGKYGTPAELAGATLGFTWATVFCVGILSSINQGFSVLAAQLFGAKKYNELGLLFQRNAFVLVLITIPLLLSLLFADVILLSLGLQEDVSIQTGIYLKCAIPSVLGLAYFECIKYYLIAQNCFHLQPITQGSLSIVHIFWCYLFVVVFDMPVAGVAIAKSITDVCTAVMLWICYKYSKYSKIITIQWDINSCLEKWWPHLKQTLVLGANGYVEWIALEISLFIVGMLNDEYILGAQGVTITIMNVFFMLPLGNSVSMQAYIGNSAGEGSKNKVQKYMFVGISMNVVMTLANSLIIIIWSKEIAEFFTNNEQTQDILQTMLSIYSISHIADTTVSHFSGVLRSIGSEYEVLVSFLICYVGIGVNCEWIFGIALGFGYPAVWYSMGFGMYLMAAWSIRKIVNLDWDAELLKIRERTEESSYIEMAEK